MTETTLALIKLLADGNLHSGEYLAQQLSISRTAIWKQIKKIEELGLVVASVAGKGYQLETDLELLNEVLVRETLSRETLAAIESIYFFDEIDSTNQFLLSQEVKNKVLVCTAEHQSAGRGRRGRQWVSPFAQNIYLSLSFQIESGMTATEGLSLAVGVELVKVLEFFGVRGLKLKWPNDLVFQVGESEFRKLAGVLIEAQGDLQGRCKMVIGVGLNLKTNSFSTDHINQPWISLQEIQTLNISRNEIIVRLIESLVNLIKTFEVQGFVNYRNEWMARAAFLNQSVQLDFGQRQVQGQLLGVDARGALIIAEGGQESVYHGGEISLRAVSKAS